MSPCEPAVEIAGALASHPQAKAFAQEIQRVHYRYATEVVGAFELCPFMNDPATAFGRFCVMLDPEPILETAVAQVEAGSDPVVHLIYPLVKSTARHFESFGNQIHEYLAQNLPSPPVHATFHPEMQGGTNTAGRLVGMLRRAPDPFVQFVPQGLHEGGTTFLDSAALDAKLLLMPKPGHAQRNFARLSQDTIDKIEANQNDIIADRSASYAQYLEVIV